LPPQWQLPPDPNRAANGPCGVRSGMILFSFGIEASEAAFPVEDSETAIGILQAHL
jgi:hypothetical protein